MHFDQAFDNRQPKTCASYVQYQWTIAAVEALEQARTLSVCDAHTSILHVNLNFISCRSRVLYDRSRVLYDRSRVLYDRSRVLYDRSRCLSLTG